MQNDHKMYTLYLQSKSYTAATLTTSGGGKKEAVSASNKKGKSDF